MIKSVSFEGIQLSCQEMCVPASKTVAGMAGDSDNSEEPRPQA